MTCLEWRNLFKKWMSENMSGENNRVFIPANLKAHAEECSACSKRLKTAQILFRGPGFPGHGFYDKAPDGLSKKITNRILQNQGKKKSRNVSWVFVPLAAAALVIITFVFTLTFFSKNDTTITIHLSVEIHDAATVSVVGDWNGWNPDIDRLKDTDGDGIWEIILKLARNNEYRYQFLINNEEWIPDPASPVQVDDGFGGINSVLEI